MAGIFIVFNVILYGIYLWRYVKRKGFDTGAFLFSMYFFVAIMGVVLFNYPNRTTVVPEHEITLIPFLYLFILLVISFNPLNRLKTIKKGSIIHPNETYFAFFIYFVALITILRFPSLVRNLSENLILMVTDTSYLSGVYTDMADKATSGFTSGGFNIIAILGGMVDDISIFLFMYYLTRPKRNKLLTIILGIASILSPLGALAQARRGSMAFSVLGFIAFYFLFKDCYGNKLRMVVRRVLIVFITAVVSGLSLITISRFTKSYMDDDFATYSMIYYIGQPMLYFNQSCMDPGGHRWGDRTIPLFKSFIDPYGAYTYHARMDKYSYLKADESVFTTFIGELVLDWGMILTFIFICIFTFILYRAGPKATAQYNFYRLIPIVALINVLIWGWTQSPFADVGGNLHIIFFVLMYIYFSVGRKKESQC